MSELKNLDLESVEALLQQNPNVINGDRDEERRHKKKKHKSRSKSRSRSKSHKKKSRKRSKSGSRSKRSKESKSRRRSRSRSKDDKKNRSGSRKKSKDRDRERGRNKDKETERKNSKDDDNIDLETIEARQKERMEKEEEERKKREVKIFEDKIADAKKQLDDARRDDSTVLILNLSIKSEERDIYEFFTKNNCGKIRDIRVIRDPRSGKSKGVAYIEFYTLDSVNKAIAHSGKELQNSKLRILPSKAEINRTAAAAKQIKQTKNPTEHQQATGAMRVFVSGLTEQLADIEESDLRDLFAPFGDVEKVELHRDDVTGKSKGYAFVLYRNSGDARRAIIEMDGFVINGKKIKVQPIQAGMANMLQDSSNFDLDDESGNNYLQTAQSRAILMQKLQRDNQEGGANLTGMAGYQEQPAAREPAQPARPQTSLLPTNCILLSNMFDVNEVDLANDPGYFVDLKEEIEDECKKFGDVENIFIEASKEGNVWIKFKEGRGASTTYQTLNNKFFSGRKIICSYVTANTFDTKFRSSVS